MNNSNNEKNAREYEQLIEDSRVKKDTYWDRNNIFVKIILLVLFIFCVASIAYYLYMWLHR